MKLITSKLDFIDIPIEYFVGYINDEKQLICLGEIFNNLEEFNFLIRNEIIELDTLMIRDIAIPYFNLNEKIEIINLGSEIDLKNLKNLASNYNMDISVKKKLDPLLITMNLTSEEIYILQQFITNTFTIKNELKENYYNDNFLNSDLIIMNQAFDILRNSRKKNPKISNIRYSLVNTFNNITSSQITSSDILSIRIPDIDMLRNYKNKLKNAKIKNIENYDLIENRIFELINDYITDFVYELKSNDLQRLGIRQSSDKSNYESTECEVIGNDVNDHLSIFINEKSFYDALKNFIIEYIKIFSEDEFDKNLILSNLYTSDNRFMKPLIILINGYISLGIYENWAFIRNMSEDERAFVYKSKQTMLTYNDDDNEEEENNDVYYGITEKQLLRQFEEQYLDIAKVCNNIGSNSQYYYLDKIKTFMLTNDCSTLAVLELIIKLFRWGNRKPRNIYLEWGEMHYSLRNSYLDLLEMDTIFTGNSLAQKPVDFTDEYQYNFIGFGISEYKELVEGVEAPTRPLSKADILYMEQFLNIEIPEGLKNGIRLNSIITSFLFNEYYTEFDKLKSRLIAVDLFDIKQFLNEHTAAGIRLDSSNNIELFNYEDEETGINGINYNNLIFIDTFNLSYFYKRNSLQMCKIFFDKTLYKTYSNVKTADEQFNFTAINLIDKIFNKNLIVNILMPKEKTNENDYLIYKEFGYKILHYIELCNDLNIITNNTIDTAESYTKIYHNLKSSIKNIEDEIKLRIELINDVLNTNYKIKINKELKIEDNVLLEKMEISEKAIFYFTIENGVHHLYVNSEFPDLPQSSEYKYFTNANAGYRLLVDKVKRFEETKQTLKLSRACLQGVQQIISFYAKIIKTGDVKTVYAVLEKNYKC